MSLIINYVMCNLYIKETEISQKQNKGSKTERYLTLLFSVFFQIRQT